MDTLEAIRGRASVRNLQAVEIPEVDLEQILDAGRRAPSGSNKQPLEFLVVKNPVTIKALAQSQACLASVSVIIVLVGDPDRSDYWLEDVSAAATQMLLAIHALGYASVWIQGTLRKLADSHKKLLGIPEHMRLVVALPIGKALESVEQRPKRPLSEMVYYEQFGKRRG
jgi:nitroreductase